jgi:lipopolysaccharide/colanic/teichoic acid biosynthesis glycosyltransferase
MQGLQASFSRPLRVRSAGAAETKSLGRTSTVRPALFVDAERSITTTAFADVGFALGSDNEVAPRERDESVSRALNIVIAVVGLVVLAPLVALIALAIKLTSRGPVLYSQTRVGVDRRWRFARNCDRRLYDHGGRLFTMYKFRTMQVNAEPDGRAVWASKADPRVTLIGKFLRGTRLDEVPQLWNVLRGDMSLVGPRPKPRELIDRYRSHYQQTLSVRPGLSHLPGVSGRNTLRRSQMIAMDQEYVGHVTLGGDLRLLAKTVPVVLFRHGFESDNESEGWVEDVPPDGFAA